MARIYNFMTGPIHVNHGVGLLQTESINIAQGQRSGSLNWTHSNLIQVWDQNNAFICSFEFGLQAQIQGGNYAIIQPGSFVVYDSNHDEIATGSTTQFV